MAKGATTEREWTGDDPCGCSHYSDGAIWMCEEHYLTYLKDTQKRLRAGKAPKGVPAISFTSGDFQSDLAQDIADYEKIVEDRKK